MTKFTLPMCQNEKTKVLKKIKNYTIYNTTHLDTDSEITDKSGHVEIDSSIKIYWFRGDLPKYILKELSKIMESRGFKYYYNNGSFLDCIRK